MQKTLVPALAFVLVALSTQLFAVAPPAPLAQPGLVAAMVAPANPSCQVAVASPGGEALPQAAAVPTFPAWLSVDGLSKVETRSHGYCPCGCSRIPDCNTSADCFGGAPCRQAISCC
jgi:hypothetical protein